MTTVKVKFRRSNATSDEGKIHYLIIRNRDTATIATDLSIRHCEWNCRSSTIITDAPRPRHQYLCEIADTIRTDTWRLLRIIDRLDKSRIEYTPNNVVDEYHQYAIRYTLFNYMRHIIDRLKAAGRIRTSETYRSTLSVFRKFRGGTDIDLDHITPQLIEAFEAWNKERRLVPNTISFYNRILKAVYNRAVDEDIIDDLRPFRHVYTGIDKTVKRALPLNIIRKIKALNLSQKPYLEYTRDIFLLSFYLRGMSFVDMAFLRKTDLNKQQLTYRRHKTGQLLVIRWTGEMQSLVDKYPPNESDYLLPIIRNRNINERFAYRNAAYRINRNLKTIASMIGLHISLTLYVARHSWASAAQSNGIPLNVISEGMGHNSELTTRIYLSQLDTSVVDRANDRIIKSIS